MMMYTDGRIEIDNLSQWTQSEESRKYGEYM